MAHKNEFSEADLDRIIEMAWEDRTPFEAIKFQFNLSEAETIKIMRSNLKRKSFNLWRRRAHTISQKHLKKRSEDIKRFKFSFIKTMSMNKLVLCLMLAVGSLSFASMPHISKDTAKVEIQKEQSLRTGKKRQKKKNLKFIPIALLSGILLFFLGLVVTGILLIYLLYIKPFR